LGFWVIVQNQKACVVKSNPKRVGGSAKNESPPVFAVLVREVALGEPVLLEALAAAPQSCLAAAPRTGLVALCAPVLLRYEGKSRTYSAFNNFWPLFCTFL
jgi:hypothetical protein